LIVVNPRRTALPWILAAATAQLVVLGAASPIAAGENVALCALVLAVPIAASHLAARSWRWWHAMAIVGALGGLGMVIGAQLDARSSDLPACHTGGGGLVTWMTGAMLVGCVPGCLWLVPSCRATRTWLGHAACFAGMMLGMQLAARWLTPVLDAMVTPPATHHIAMVLGMMFGAAGGYRAIHEEVARDPPGSITATPAAGRRAGQAPVPPRATAQLRRAADSRR
jgi:hypothetical protein